MSLYQNTKRIIQRLNRGVALFGVLFLIPMMLLTSGEVLRRAVWNRPIPGTMELSSYMLALFVLLGIAWTHQVKGHVRVTMLTSRLPERWAAGVDMVTTLLSIFIMALLAWQGWVVGVTEHTVSDMLRIPQMPFRLLVVVAGGFLCLELLFDLVESGAKLLGRS